MAKITIMVPVYNVEQYLRRCLDSILAQTFKDFDLILVDDGSTDGSPSICDEYRAKDGRVNVIHKPNGGVSSARNACLDWAFLSSDSEWLMFVDADDWIHPLILEALMNAAKETGLPIAICEFECAYDAIPQMNTENLTAKICNTETYFCEHNTSAVVPYGKIYKKECYEGIRYPIGRIHEDEFVAYKILFEHEVVAVIDEPLYAYFQTPNSLMRSKWSPARLDKIDALEERAQYFLSRGNEKMYHYTLCVMFGNIEKQFRLVKSLDPETKKFYGKQIEKIHKQKVKEYRKDLSLRTNRSIFTFEHPFLMWPYNRFMRLHGYVARARELGISGTFAHIIEKRRRGNA